MQSAPSLLSLLLALLAFSRSTNALCNLENGTVARCHELQDVKYIETYDLESLKASVIDRNLDPEVFNNLSTLRHLDLSGGDLKRIGPASFRNLHDLRSLDLSDNQIEYLELPSLDGLNQLRSLNLRRNSLTQLPPVLARLKNLKHLDVQGNPFHCNCATLRVRDLLTKRGVKLSKRIACASPANMKGASIMKPEASIVCAFEEQDREMQGDQAYEGSGDEDTKNDSEYEDYFEITSKQSIEEKELETPSPESQGTSSSTPASTASILEDPTKAVVVTDASLEKITEEEDEIFFDTDDRKDHTSTSSISSSTEKQPVKDSLFYPVEGSGDGDDEGSGEGSGTNADWSRVEEETSVTSVEPSTSGGLMDMLFGVFWSTTAAPEKSSDPDLEEEQFIDASPTKAPVAEEPVLVAKKVETMDSAPSSTTERVVTKSTISLETIQSGGEGEDMSKSGKVILDNNDSTDNLAEVSPAKQSKKGMGSYVVLVALLAVLAALIGFAAYKGDFCRKKRKRNDVENGTELKDMRKALLDTGNSAQPKIASNGNAESVPLVEGTPDPDEPKVTRRSSKVIESELEDAATPLNASADHGEPVKPPRKNYTSVDDSKAHEEPDGVSSSFKDDSISSRTSPVESDGVPITNGQTRARTEANGPPLSPGAQRVKITLQENPDSVPRTPILITRTMTGENLVKAP